MERKRFYKDLAERDPETRTMPDLDGGELLSLKDAEWYSHLNGGSVTVTGIGDDKVMFINNANSRTFVLSRNEWRSLVMAIQDNQIGDEV